MRYEGSIYRPPSEANSYILQATVGCSWNHCTYCDMYRDKAFRVRDLDATLADVRAAGRALGPDVTKVFVADGDALVMGPRLLGGDPRRLPRRLPPAAARQRLRHGEEPQREERRGAAAARRAGA